MSSIVMSRVSQQAARYTPLGSNAESCGRCRFYMAPSSCGRIVGPVSPRGWCKYYSREMVQTYGGSIIASGTQIPSGATLDLSFMTPGTLDPRITFTRASTATYTDFNGVTQTAGVNAPRWDYTGGSLRGLLIEEARTNTTLSSGNPGAAPWAPAATVSPLLLSPLPGIRRPRRMARRAPRALSCRRCRRAPTPRLFRKTPPPTRCKPRSFSVWMKGIGGGDRQRVLSATPDGAAILRAYRGDTDHGVATIFTDDHADEWRV